MTEKLGPCPLCGGEAQIIRGLAECRDAKCLMSRGRGGIPAHSWNRLSALAASERRMREALEWCRKQFEEYAEQHELKAMSAQICGGMPREVREREIKARTNRDMAFMCNEALKGGEG